MVYSAAFQEATKLLTEKGFQVNGTNVTEPEYIHPLDTIALSDKLSDIIFENSAGDSFAFFLIRNGDNLELVSNEI